MRGYTARSRVKYLTNVALKKMQNETNAAIVIQHFFIKIKAEIEMEIVRMKKVKAVKKKSRGGEQRFYGTQSKYSSRTEIISIGLGSFDNTGSYSCGGLSDRFFQNGDQDFKDARIASYSAGGIPSVDTVGSTGNEGSNAHHSNVNRIVASRSTDMNQHYVMSGGQSKSYVHREQEYNTRNLPFSREQSPSRKFDYPNMDRNHRDDDNSHAGWRTQSSQSSVLSKQMHGPYHTSNQAFHTLPTCYGNPHSYRHPPFNHDPNLQALQGAQNSLSEPNQWHNRHILTARDATANVMPHSSSNLSVRTSDTDRHPQHEKNKYPTSSFYQSATRHFADHLRLSTQNQPPSHNNDHRGLRQYHQNDRY